MPEPDQVLDFWFAEGRDKQWFDGGPAFDAAVKAALGPAFEAARSGTLETWRDTARGCLALCILFDQYPRNVFRGTPEAFAWDGAALEVTRHALAQGFDAALTQTERLFLYLPLEHSESLTDQKDCLRLVAALDENPEWLDYAAAHHDIIDRFGRFPHRNDVLGRPTTDEEHAFLKEPGSSF
ncbi:MAG TPA: DUF924 domain-containing protein [Kiloniellaceae bacterium]|nr:DUF924 domain-containing protein [Kiloniellaceae bacterium]